MDRGTPMKTTWILTSILAVISMALGVEVVKKVELEQQFNTEHPAAERWTKQCFSVRSGLTLARHNLRPNGDREFGLSVYRKTTRDNWADVNACALDERIVLGDPCFQDETSCILHAIDWALVNIQ